jgi:hypothetical protein
MLPQAISSKKDQRPPGDSFIFDDTPLYSTTPVCTNNVNYFKLIISKIVFKQKIAWRKKFQANSIF